MESLDLHRLNELSLTFFIFLIQITFNDFEVSQLEFVVSEIIFYYFAVFNTLKLKLFLVAIGTDTLTCK